LPENGYHPIVLTRNWTGEELTEEQRLTNSGSSVRLEKNENGEVYYMPYKSSWRDECFIKSQNNKAYSYLSKALTAMHLIFQNFTIYAIPYRNIYYQAKKIIRENREIKHLIISGNPFEQFFFGYLLKKEFQDLNWIADYRDDWTTSELIKKRNFLNELIHSLEKISERKWTKSCSLVLSVSNHYSQKLSTFLSKRAFTIYNGFDLDVKKSVINHTNDFFITYNGTLYESQPIEIFVNGFKEFIDNNPNINIHIFFPGLAISLNQKKRVEKLLSNYEKNYTITDRQPKKNVIDLQLQSEILLMVSHQNIKGVPSSKIFEYIGLKKQFIVCPGDNDVLEHIAKTSTLGVVLNTSIEVKNFLQKSLEKKLRGNVYEFNELAIENFSVKNQVKILSTIIKEN
jgi:glycosyltransferase involved in cell wall biosynthesis